MLAGPGRLSSDIHTDGTSSPVGNRGGRTTGRTGPLSLLQAAMHRHVDVDPDPDRSGIYRLWLRVTADAIESVIHRRAYWRTSEDFIFTEGNIFFEDAVCQNWGISAERARDRIRKIMEDRK